jgi:hypothetical protein
MPDSKKIEPRWGSRPSNVSLKMSIYHTENRGSTPKRSLRILLQNAGQVRGDQKVCNDSNVEQ